MNLFLIILTFLAVYLMGLAVGVLIGRATRSETPTLRDETMDQLARDEASLADRRRRLFGADAGN